MTLGGNVTIRNGFALDYCWQEAVKSLLPICDEVVICDIESDDGTKEAIHEWCRRDDKITPVSMKWTDPRGDNQWWPEALNYARQHLSTDMHIQLDADELLHEEDYPHIKEASNTGRTFFFQRLNFFKDHRNLIPEGVCCGTKVIRMAKKDTVLPSDYPYEPARQAMAEAQPSGFRIFHYGFLRRREAFFKKEREVLRIWANTYDSRLEAAERYEGNWFEMPGVTGWESRLVPYTGTHPTLAKEWLRNRGYSI